MGFISDLKDISKLPQDDLVLLLDEINSNPFQKRSDYGRFDSFCAKHEIDEDVSRKLYSILTYIASYCIDKRSIIDGLNEIEKNIIEHHPDDVSVIWSYFKEHTEGFNQFILNQKEKELNNVGEKLGSLNIICDARPLYDISRKNIIKYTYPILISIQGIDSDEKKVYELSEDKLPDLKKEIDVAINKLQILKKQLDNG